MHNPPIYIQMGCWCPHTGPVHTASAIAIFAIRLFVSIFAKRRWKKNIRRRLLAEEEMPWPDLHSHANSCYCAPIAASGKVRRVYGMPSILSTNLPPITCIRTDCSTMVSTQQPHMLSHSSSHATRQHNQLAHFFLFFNSRSFALLLLFHFSIFSLHPRRVFAAAPANAKWISIVAKWNTVWNEKRQKE